MRLIKGNVERIAKSETQVERLKAAGFKTLGDTTKLSSPGKQGKQFDEMTVSELRAYAKERGLEGCSSLTKDELLSLLKERFDV